MGPIDFGYILMPLYKIALMIIAALLVVFCVFKPDWLSDQNSFLSEFMNHNFLAVVGVLLAINLGSLSQLHLSLNQLEKEYGNGLMRRTRGQIKSSVWWMIASFLFSIFLMLVKPIVAINPSIEAIINSLAIFVFVFYVFTMADVTLGVFELPARLDDPEGDEPPE